MSADEPLPDDLDAAVAEVFRGSVERFVARRDDLVRRLRAEGRTDEAAEVKRLRKPTRAVWALDAAVLTEPATADHLVRAVVAMVDAQRGHGDLRDASRQLRDAAQGLAGAAASVAAEHGHRVDAPALVPAVLAVVADRDALAALRAGRLTDIPEPQDLDALTEPPDLDLPPGLRTVPSAEAKTEPAEPADSATLAAARAALDRAETDAAAAQDAVSAAESVAEEATADAEAADMALERAEVAARAARTQLRQAQQAARQAREQARQAERTAAKARGRLDRLQSAR